MPAPSSRNSHINNCQRVKKQKYHENSVFRPAFLRMVIDDEKNLGFQTVEEAAYMCLNVLIGAADTVGPNDTDLTTIECLLDGTNVKP